MALWSAFQADSPALAATVRERFDAGVNKTIATIRDDGAPRISGTEVVIGDGGVTIGVMPGSMKLLDIERDPRVAIHGPTIDPPADNPSGWAGEAKLAGRLSRIEPPPGSIAEGVYFELDIVEAVVTSVSGDDLVIESWHPVRGYQRRTRR